jgi:hypothetical protein
VEKAKNLRVRVGGVPVLEKMQPFIGLKGMAGAAPHRRKQRLFFKKNQNLKNIFSKNYSF